MRFVTRALAAAVLGLTTSLASASLSSSDWREPGDGLLTIDSDTGLAWLDLTQTSGLSFDAVAAGTWQAQGFRFATLDEANGLVRAGARGGEAPFLSLLGGVAAPDDIAVLAGGPTLMLTGIIGGDVYDPEGVLPMWTIFETRNTQISPSDPISDLPWGSIADVIDAGEPMFSPIEVGELIGGSVEGPSSGSLSALVASQLRDAPAGDLGTYIRIRSSFADPHLGVSGAGVFMVREVSAIPEPTSAWLMGVGLLALAGGVARRRSA